MIGSIRIGCALLHCFLESDRAGDLKCHFRGVDFVIRSIVQFNLYVYNFIASQNTSLHCTAGYQRQQPECIPSELHRRQPVLMNS